MSPFKLAVCEFTAGVRYNPPPVRTYARLKERFAPPPPQFLLERFDGRGSWILNMTRILWIYWNTCTYTEEFSNRNVLITAPFLLVSSLDTDTCIIWCGSDHSIKEGHSEFAHLYRHWGTFPGPCPLNIFCSIWMFVTVIDLWNMFRKFSLDENIHVHNFNGSNVMHFI